MTSQVSHRLPAYNIFRWQKTLPRSLQSITAYTMQKTSHLIIDFKVGASNLKHVRAFVILDTIEYRVKTQNHKSRVIFSSNHCICFSTENANTCSILDYLIEALQAPPTRIGKTKR